MVVNCWPSEPGGSHVSRRVVEKVLNREVRGIRSNDYAKVEIVGSLTAALGRMDL